jgi:hypothetical protein
MVVLSLLATTGSAAAAGTIEGEVIDSVSKAGVEEVEACVYEAVTFKFVACTETDQDGAYALTGLSDGGYLVEFWAPYLGYVPQFFDGAALPEEADEVTIAGGGTASGVDAEIELGGAIEGRVTDADTGSGLPGVEVCVESATNFGGCILSGFGGNYAIGPLGTGSYTVEFSGASYAKRYYNEQASSGSANLVSVLAPGTTSGIDARLSRSGPSIVVRPVSVPTTPILGTAKKPKAVKCRKGFKKVKRHGRKVCVKKHKKKKHRS